jgi:NADH-quinone oxidoreductase subunit J
MTSAALWTVMSRSVLKATIGLAVTSSILTILMFNLSSPLAAVFELSVCTGLITVVFVSTISLTKPLTHKQTIEVSKNRMKRFIYLPIIMILAAGAMFFVRLPTDMTVAASNVSLNTTMVMWNTRQLDMLGQIILIIAGALGVALLFKKEKDDEP